MLGEIFVVAATAVVTKKILGFLFNQDNENQAQSEEEIHDVQVIGSVLPEESEPSIPIPPVTFRQPGEPLWQNHRLYERALTPQRPGAIDSMEHLFASVSRNQMEPNIDVSSMFEQMANRPHQQELEDPFSDGTQSGWVYRDGQRLQR